MNHMQRFLLVALALAALGAGCSKSFDEYFRATRAGGSLTDPDPDPSNSPGQSHVECTNQNFTQPAAQIVHSVDVLFIVDTSGSMANIRADIASNLGSFVRQLPDGTDYRVGVMLAHGSTSPHYGKLFAPTGIPPVLNSVTQTKEQIASDLHDIMVGTVADSGSAGGEEGMVALNHAVDPVSVTAMRAQGFLRETAALAIIFIADENDVCAIYPSGVTPVPNGDGSEEIARKRDCGGVTAESVVAKVRAFQGTRPTTFNGVIYNNLATAGQGSEKEYGYGYVDIIRVANGVSIDLGSPPFATGLAAIGSLVTTQLNLVTDIHIIHPDMVPSTLRVKVDGLTVPFDWQPTIWSVHLIPNNTGHALSLVEINYCRGISTSGKAGKI